MVFVILVVRKIESIAVMSVRSVCSEFVVSYHLGTFIRGSGTLITRIILASIFVAAEKSRIPG